MNGRFFRKPEEIFRNNPKAVLSTTRKRPVTESVKRILNILDLNDIYMAVYLQADDAGKLTLGDEARDCRPRSRICDSRKDQPRRSRRPGHAKDRRNRRGVADGCSASSFRATRRFSVNTISYPRIPQFAQLSAFASGIQSSVVSRRPSSRPSRRQQRRSTLTPRTFEFNIVNE